MQQRTLTISGMSEENRPEVPFIRLRGKWLQKLGFEIGQKILVEEKEGQLILKAACVEERDGNLILKAIKEDQDGN